jgi:hypothetical protein
MDMMTEKHARHIINAIWWKGENMTGKFYDTITPLLPHAELPILDRLLSVCGVLDQYNAQGRPAFANFRNWWYSTNVKKTS